MIESIHIKGFQTHRSITLAFDPQLTSLTGPSDSGKSSILRALRWVFLNQGPKDKDLIHWEEGVCRVTVVVDGHKITRVKGPGKNLYILDGRKFKSFGAVVPDEIRQILNIGIVNFQGQLDPHFWFNETPGQLSKTLNNIINLGTIDKTVGYLAAQQRRAKTIYEDRLESSKESRRQLKRLSWVPDFLEEHEGFTAWEKKVGKLTAQVAGLRFLVRQGQSARKQARNAAKAGEQAREMAVRGTVLLTARADTIELKQLIQEYKSWRRKEKELRESSRTLATHLKEETKGRCPLCRGPWHPIPRT